MAVSPPFNSPDMDFCEHLPRTVTGKSVSICPFVVLASKRPLMSLGIVTVMGPLVDEG